MQNVTFLPPPEKSGSLLQMETDVRARIQKATSPDQMDKILEELSEVSKRLRLNEDQKLHVKRLRQQAYDRKRRLKDDGEEQWGARQPELLQAITTKEETEVNTVGTMPMKAIQEPITAIQLGGTLEGVPFWQGVIRGLKRIDGEKFVLALPRVLGLLMAAALVSGLLWQQSTELYRSSGFTQPELIAAGGLLMVVGFAAFYSYSRSWLALFLCLYAGGYEAYFVISATFQDERIALERGVAENPVLALLGEKVARAKERYLGFKERFENPVTEMFQNAWFKKKYLEPAWDSYLGTQEQFLAKSKELKNVAPLLRLVWLKVFYRIGLILLCMIESHLLWRFLFLPRSQL